jgi:hypothetical protein
MDAVLDDLVVWARHEADTEGSAYIWADDDLGLTLGSDPPTQRLRSEPGYARQVVGIDHDVVQRYRHAR